MSITPATLFRSAGVAAVAAGLIFIGVQVNHPHLDASTVDTTNVVVRDWLKVLMAVLALVGITGMYLRQVKRTGLLGLIGYVVFAVGYLLITCTSFVAAAVLPLVGDTDPAFVDAVTAAGTKRGGSGDLGLLGTVIELQGFGFLLGSLLFGIALYRAGVLVRWATVLLAVGGIVTAALAAMPDAFYRLLAFPNGIAMIALGCSLWLSVRAAGTSRSTEAGADRDTAGV